MYKTFHYICLIIVLLLNILLTEKLQAQTYELLGREYRFIDGKWYNFSGGQKGYEIVTNILIVRPLDGIDLINFNFEQLGLTNVNVITDELLGGYYAINVGENQDPFYAASIISNNALFDCVEFDGIVEYFGIPNDPLYQYQWNLDKISISTAWDITTGSSSVILGIIDSGIDYNHEDIFNQLWVNPSEDRNGNGSPDFYPYVAGGDLDDVDNDNNGKVDDLIGWDFTEDNDNTPNDDYGHGTAVAGIALAQTNNNLGIAGIAGGWENIKGVRLMVLRIGASGYTVWQAITYAVRNNAKVINMSIGAGGISNAINIAANEYNCVIVAAAGNYNHNPLNPCIPITPTSISYPASDPNVIAVGASIENDNRKELCDGTDAPNWGSCYGPQLDVVAPGIHTWTTDITGSAGRDPGNYWASMGGTSGASPHVAGLAALIRSKKPYLKWWQVRDIIRHTADKVPSMGGQNFTNEYGYGRINAHRALLYTDSVNPPPPTITLSWKKVSVSGKICPRLSWYGLGPMYDVKYKIYRSFNSTTNFQLIDSTSNTTTTYIDESIVTMILGSQFPPSNYVYYQIIAFQTYIDPDLQTNTTILYESNTITVPSMFDYITEELKIALTDSTKPLSFSIEQNYPNPFNPLTIINYQLPEAAYVTLKIYDVLGREIATLVDRFEEAGYKVVEFDASNFPSCMFFYKLQAGNFISVKKMLLVR